MVSTVIPNNSYFLENDCLMKQLSASHLDSVQPGIAAVFSLLNKKLLEDNGYTTLY